MFSQEINILKNKLKVVSQLIIVRQDRNIIMGRQRIGEQSTSQLGRFYVEFINKLMGVGNKRIVGLEELRDGVVLCEILSGVEGMELRGGYNEDPIGFVQILGNMKYIIKQIERYWNSVLGMGLQEQMDLISMCKGGQQQQLIKLIRLVIRTLLLSAQKKKYIQHILQTSQQSQTYFMQLINQQNHHPPSTNSFHHNHTLYIRLQQLQRQNDKLLKIIQQMQHQMTTHKQLSKQTQQKNRQQNRIISTLSQQLKLLKIHFYENQQQHQELQLLSSHQHKLESKMEEKIIEMCEQEQSMRRVMQRLKSLIQAQASELQSITKKNSQLTQYKAKHDQLLSYNQLLHQKLQNLQSKISLLETQLQLSQQSNSNYQQQTLQLRKSLFSSENTVRQKNQLIQQLDNNIKYLLQQSQPNTCTIGSSSHNNNNRMKQSITYNNQKTTTLKEQFQSVIISNKQHFILTKLTEENILLNKQLKSTQEENNKLHCEIEQLLINKQQNHKLVQMITHMQNYRGEENQLLVKTIYRMKIKMLQQQFIGINNTKNTKDHVLKDINRHH